MFHPPNRVIPATHNDHMTEGLIMALLVSLALAILAVKMQSLPIIFISSLGWMVSALQVWQQTSEVLPMILLMMLAFGQFFVINRGSAA